MQLQTTLLLCVFYLVSADDVLLQKRMFYPGEVPETYDPKVKKPFCNAFTGCGRKRSDSMASLVELGGEPAVEDLTRQILSQAKLWEAIQEAKMELGTRRHRQSLQQDEEEDGRVHPMPLPTGHKRSSQPHFYYYT